MRPGSVDATSGMQLAPSSRIGEMKASTYKSRWFHTVRTSLEYKLDQDHHGTLPEVFSVPGDKVSTMYILKLPQWYCPLCCRTLSSIAILKAHGSIKAMSADFANFVFSTDNHRPFAF